MRVELYAEGLDGDGPVRQEMTRSAARRQHRRLRAIGPTVPASSSGDRLHGEGDTRMAPALRFPWRNRKSSGSGRRRSQAGRGGRRRVSGTTLDNGTRLPDNLLRPLPPSAFRLPSRPFPPAAIRYMVTDGSERTGWPPAEPPWAATSAFKRLDGRKVRAPQDVVMGNAHRP